MENVLFITGGVVSSLGKGVTAAALGALLQARGLKVGMVKIDGYLNVDAGLMSPAEHGEVYVTHDGVETDLDIGNYERFLGTEIDGRNSITTGRVYTELLALERKGHFLGKTVQVIPHLTNHIKSLVLERAAGRDITLVEIGGVVGDIESMPFLEAARELHFSQRDKCAFLHLGLVPYLEHCKQNKTKPIQHSVRALLSMGIQPDLIICRTQGAIGQEEHAKISLFCNVELENVVCSPDIRNKYELPVRLAEAGVDAKVLRRFAIGAAPRVELMAKWYSLADLLAARDSRPCVRIGIVRKYLNNPDSYLSLVDSLVLAGVRAECNPKIVYVDTDLSKEEICRALDGLDCVVVPGGWGESGVERMIEAIRHARETNLPFLGICYGFQLAMIEMARNVLGLADAHTEEVNPETPNAIIVQLSKMLDREHSETQLISSVLRLGTCTLNQVGDSVFRQIYSEEPIRERFRHRYTFNGRYREQFEAIGVKFAVFGDKEDRKLYDAFQYAPNELHIGVQYHPELRSAVFAPNPVLEYFVARAAKKVCARVSA